MDITTYTSENKHLRKFPFNYTVIVQRLGLVRTSVDRIYDTNKTWLGFHNNIQEFIINIRGKNIVSFRR